MTNGKPKEELPKFEAKANDILKQVKAGGDFAALAKQYSDDPGSKDKGGEYEGVVRGQMDPAFEQAAFALEAEGNQQSGQDASMATTLCRCWIASRRR